MIKLESIIKNDNRLGENISPITLLIDKKKFNYIYSNKQEELDDIFSIMSGFYQTRLGHIIYDDYNFNEMSFRDRSLFIKNNLEIISQFSNVDRNKSIYSLMKRHMIFSGSSCKYNEKNLVSLLDKFNLQNLAYEKLKNLTNDNILKFHILLASLKQPKYIFIYNFEKYISDDKNILSFINNLKQHLPEESTFVFFSTKNITDNKEFEFFDLTHNILTKTNILYVRNKKYISEKKFKNNAFNLMGEIILDSKWLLISFLLLNSLLLTAFFVTNTINLELLFDLKLLTQIKAIVVILMFILNIGFVIYFLIHNNYLIFKMTRSGQYLFKIIFIYGLIYTILFFFTIGITLIYPLIEHSSILNTFNWILIALIPSGAYVISLFIFFVIFIFNYKKILRKNTDFV